MTFVPMGISIVGSKVHPCMELDMAGLIPAPGQDAAVDRYKAAQLAHLRARTRAERDATEQELRAAMDAIVWVPAV